MKRDTTKLISVSDAKAKLSALVRSSADEDIVLLRYGRPAAVLMSTQRFDALMERIEDLEDSLAASEAIGEETVPVAELARELGVRVPERL